MGCTDRCEMPRGFGGSVKIALAVLALLIVMQYGAVAMSRKKQPPKPWDTSSWEGYD